MGELTGSFELYKGRKQVARVTLERGQFTGVSRIYDRALLPPYIWGSEEMHSATLALRQFFHFRFLSPKNPYYNIGKDMLRESYVSLFDDYHLAVVPKPYDLPAYQLEKDAFFHMLMDGGTLPDVDAQSPNLSLFYPQLSLYEQIDSKRFILFEYSKALADMQKAAGISYTIQIRADIPFIRVELPTGELYPLPAICSPTLDMPSLEVQLKKIDPVFTLDTYDPDYCVLAVTDAGSRIVML